VSAAVFQRTKKNYPLTSVRFVAALLVVFHHSARSFLPVFAKINMTRIPPGLIDRGLFSLTVSVSFFFLLSGYVLGFVYLRKGHAVNKRFFWAARFARIYPLYFVMLVLDSQQLLRVELQQHGMMAGLFKTAKVFVANVLMMQTWFTSRLLRINAPSWSLCAEVFFYLCFPVLGGWLWKLRGARLWMAAFVLYVGGQALVWVVRPHVGTEALLSSPPLHLSTFALGILLARWQTLQEEQRGGAPPLWHVMVVLGFSVGGVLLSLWALPLFHVAGPYNHGLLAPVFAGLIWALSMRTTWLSRLLCARWLVVLGNASYALYLIHMPILLLFRQFNWVSEWLYALYLALCLGLSVLSFYYFETPVRLWLLERLHSRSLETMEAASVAQ
jgi:peptidoglycan/LPS O-acetylase OafA/YrhL